MARIGVIDYGMGNLGSVVNALNYLGEEPCLCTCPDALRECDRLIFPGVGSMPSCIENLEREGLGQAILQWLEQGNPLLGICLGMQAMARKSEEGEGVQCLGWIDADVTRLCGDEAGIRIPHVGWNEVEFTENFPFRGTFAKKGAFYFVHSYAVKNAPAKTVGGIAVHGNPFVAAFQKGSMIGVQFHPEKSQENGIKLLQHFMEWNP